MLVKFFCDRILLSDDLFQSIHLCGHFVWFILETTIISAIKLCFFAAVSTISDHLTVINGQRVSSDQFCVVFSFFFGCYKISQIWTLIWNDFNIIWLLLVAIGKNVLITAGKLIFPGITFQILSAIRYFSFNL